MVRLRSPRPSICAHLFVLLAPGILIVLSFQCMAALFDPVHRRGEGIRWGLVSYTAVMFSAVTLQTAMNLHIVSICYIDNREFPGNDAMFSGPFAYFVLIYAEAINVVPNALFLLSNWLADGFLVCSPFMLHSLTKMSNTISPSSIVTILSTPRTSWPSPSPVSCTSALWVRI